MFFRGLLGEDMDHIIWTGLSTICLLQEVTTTTAANASSIIQRGAVVTLKNNQTLEDIIDILDAGWIVILKLEHPHFRNPRTLEALKDYPATYSVDNHWTYSPKPLALELAERLS